jgi:hypothetical protein
MYRKGTCDFAYAGMHLFSRSERSAFLSFSTNQLISVCYRTDRYGQTLRLAVVPPASPLPVAQFQYNVSETLVEPLTHAGENSGQS